VALLEGQPRVWTLIELVDELQPTPGFRNLRTPTESIRIIADGAAVAGRIERAGVGRYRAKGQVKGNFG